MEQVAPPGEAVTTYPVIGLPPSLTGAVQETVPNPTPATAFTAVGAPGGPVGVAGFEGVDGAEVPAALVAVTVTVYAVPFVKPVIRQFSVPAVVQEAGVTPAVGGVAVAV